MQFDIRTGLFSQRERQNADPRTLALFNANRREIFVATDRMFAWLMVVQWVAGIIAAVVLSPRAWAGTQSAVHLHVLAAVAVGAAIIAVPIFLAWKRPGELSTRMAVAVGQMCQSALLIHLTGGRIETHFHIFGSLAFLALYRDWRVLIAATVVVAVDHFVRGVVYPQSIYGVLSASPWRTLEHAGWVLFEDCILVVACFRSEREMWNIAQRTTAMRSDEQRISAIISSAMDSVVTINSRGEITGWNPQAETTFGLPVAEAVGRRLSHVIVPAAGGADDDATFIEQFIAGSQHGSHTLRRELQVMHRNGQLLPVEISMSAVHQDGEFVCSVFIRDISEAKRLVEQMRNARDAAEAASVAKTSFLANMSHEIRTPMTAILGYSDLLLEPSATMSDKQDSLQVIRRNARHLLQLINDILDISKIEAGKMTVERLSSDLPQLVNEVVSMTRPRALERSLDFRVVFDGPIPRTVQTDSLRVKQILMNLLGNAIKFTPKGLITLRIACERSAGGSRLMFDVADTGVGLKPEQVARLFQPFSQADESTTRRFGGTGLGLAISRRLVTMLGGEISVTSTYLVGSTFHVSFDACLPDDVEMLSNLTEAMLESPNDEKKAAPEEQIQLNGRILLAEDGADNQVLISMYLRQAGARVVVAENGRVAADLAMAEQFDMILMDMQMPVLDGYGATSELRARGFTLPIVALTAHAMSGDREKCINAGCSDYIIKPVDRRDLLRMVQKHLEAKRNASAVPASAGTAAPAGASSPAAPRTDAAPMTMEEATQLFISKLPDRVSAIVTGVAHGRLDEVRRCAHQLKGAGAGYGFPKVTDAAARAERAATAAVQAGNEAGMEVLGQLNNTIQTLIDTIRSIDGYQQSHEKEPKDVASRTGH